MGVEAGQMKPSRARYNVVLLAIGLAVLSYVQRVAISGAAIPITHDLGLSKQQMGLVFGAFGLAYALFEIPTGLLGDRLGVRRALAQVVLAWSVFTALTGAAWNVASLVTIRFLFGAGEAGCFPNLTRMEHVAAGARAGLSAGADVGECALGRRRNTAADAVMHYVVRVAMGVCEFRSAGAGVVRGLPRLVQGRSDKAWCG